MKFASFLHAGQPAWGVVTQQGIVSAMPQASAFGATLKQAIASNSLAAAAQWAATQTTVLQEADITFLPVIPDTQKILCVGINYLTHVQETGREVPTKPMIFARYADSQVAHGQPILRPHVSTHLDFEGELAVIIGKTARYVREEDALSYVAGYTCFNDGTLRDWQRHSTQFIAGKNFPQTGGCGPWLVTTDEIPDPSALSLTTRLNGQVVQQATTDDLIFSIGNLITYCSGFTALQPGDIIITGTTGGVGAFRQPPLWMKHGDVVEVEISGIGTLRNPVVDE